MADLCKKAKEHLGLPGLTYKLSFFGTSSHLLY